MVSGSLNFIPKAFFGHFRVSNFCQIMPEKERFSQRINPPTKAGFPLEFAPCLDSPVRGNDSDTGRNDKCGLLDALRPKLPGREVGRLFLGELVDRDIHCFKFQSRYFFINLLGDGVDLPLK